MVFIRWNGNFCVPLCPSDPLLLPLFFAFLLEITTKPLTDRSAHTFWEEVYLTPDSTVCYLSNNISFQQQLHDYPKGGFGRPIVTCSDFLCRRHGSKAHWGDEVTELYSFSFLQFYNKTNSTTVLRRNT